MTDFRGQKNLDREKVFWSKVSKGESWECWPWKHYLNKDGYGQFWIGHTYVVSHRYAWELSRRCEVPEGKMILHMCDNRSCCNPDHLYCGDAKQNAKDRKERGPKVPAHILGNPKLTEIEILAVREAIKLKIPQQRIAHYF